MGLLLPIIIWATLGLAASQLLKQRGIHPLLAFFLAVGALVFFIPILIVLLTIGVCVLLWRAFTAKKPIKKNSDRNTIEVDAVTLSSEQIDD